MIATIVKRLILLIPQLLLISLVTFALAWVMPGDIVSQRMLMEDEQMMSLQEMYRMRELIGLDDPWYVQYTRWMSNILRGDLGVSFQHHRPVTELIRDRMGNTFRLSLTSVILVFAMAIPLGILAGRYYRKPLDKAIQLYGFVGVALPNVVFAILLVWLFSFRLGLLPFFGSIDPLVVGTGAFAEFISRIRHLILPTLAIAVGGGISTIYFLRSQIVEGRGSDYAMTARAFGIPEKVIFRKHILRNSLMPFAPVVGFIFVGLFSGSILLERLFSFPGMGDLFMTAITQRDNNVVSALVIIYASLSALAVLIGDITITIVDPRIRIK